MRRAGAAPWSWRRRPRSRRARRPRPSSTTRSGRIAAPHPVPAQLGTPVDAASTSAASNTIRGITRFGRAQVALDACDRWASAAGTRGTGGASPSRPGAPRAASRSNTSAAIPSPQVLSRGNAAGSSSSTRLAGRSRSTRRAAAVPAGPRRPPRRHRRLLSPHTPTGAPTGRRTAVHAPTRRVTTVVPSRPAGPSAAGAGHRLSLVHRRRYGATNCAVRPSGHDSDRVYLHPLVQGAMTVPRGGKVRLEFTTSSGAGLEQPIADDGRHRDSPCDSGGIPADAATRSGENSSVSLTGATIRHPGSPT